MVALARENAPSLNVAETLRRPTHEVFARLGGDRAALASHYSCFGHHAGASLFAPTASRFATADTERREAQTSVAILGAGNGGLALAGYLARHGHHVGLWNRSPARVAPVAAAGGIHLTLPGTVADFGPITVATWSLAKALSGTRLVLVSVPATAHGSIARACAPHLRDGQSILLLPGRTGGALEFRRALRAAGCRARILVGEANTFPLAARCMGPAAAVIYGTKEDVRAAALPAARTPELLAAWRSVLPMLSADLSVLHTGFANVGAILHPTITLLNRERIARGEIFDFYTEGVTPRVAAVLAAADAERLQIARAYGVAASSLRAWIASAYGHHAATIQTAVGGNPAYVGIKAPDTPRHRYLLEDVPTGLIPLIDLGEAAGLAVPTLRRLVGLARDTVGGDLWQCPRTLDTLGLAGLGPRAIRRFVELGHPCVNQQKPRQGLMWRLSA